MDNLLEVGQVVISKAGRDKGKAYMIMTIMSADFVTVVDGKYRKFSNPKKKRVKHLSPLEDRLTNISTKLSEGKKVFDSELASALKQFFITD